MSVNLYQIHIKTVEINKVTSFLVSWLADEYGEMPFVRSNQDSSFTFFNSENPTMFALGQLHDGWLTVLHDSFEPLMDLTSSLSSSFQTSAIQALGQSTVDTYHLSIFNEGQLLRKIDAGEEYNGVEQSGEPFPFEKESMNEKIGSGEPSFFDYQDMQKYCLHFGIDLLKDPSEIDGAWEVIQLELEQKSPHSDSRKSILDNIFRLFRKKN
ncbi:hypothetical protein LCM10_04405 [Rossellomorea aquimaris]|uniref:hypothetical protein n=1 Tax=Rossellomorea aquimaris TaxID=189382 RepID=UPI001CD19B89|nr:hypothetical protein [Rossellomorea aquimaris]MCA1054219.1 hypothetical protein [Rossellomorea aquimaris]